jgi:hypothetical protein
VRAGKKVNFDPCYVATLDKRIETSSDEQEQYGRRNALRMRNVPYDDIPKVKSRNGKDVADTDSYVRDFCENKLGVSIPDLGIGRSHLLGPPNGEGKCNIIVKFVSYNVRQMVYTNRICLKDTGVRVFINEDLTKRRQTLVNELVPLRKANKIHRLDIGWSCVC